MEFVWAHGSHGDQTFVPWHEDVPDVVRTASIELYLGVLLGCHSVVPPGQGAQVMPPPAKAARPVSRAHSASAAEERMVPVKPPPMPVKGPPPVLAAKAPPPALPWPPAQMPPGTTIVNQYLMGGTMTTILQQPGPQLGLLVTVTEAPVAVAAGVPFYGGAAELMTGSGANILGLPVKESPS